MRQKAKFKGRAQSASPEPSGAFLGPTVADAKRVAQTTPKAPKASKYRNVRTMVGGEVFDSKREAEQWILLRAREELGEISGLRRQVPFALWAPSDKSENHVQVSTYLADFTFYDMEGRRHVLDAKGKRTQMYALKKKWLELQDGIVIEEV